jgi:hypothetical protein
VKGLKIAALAATSIVFTSVMAEPSLPAGWYLEANGGASKLSNATIATNSSISDSGVAWNANAGYKFMPYFAAEIGYTSYAKATAKVNGVKVATDSFYSYDIAAKALLPIADSGAEVFAKLGAAELKSKITVDNQSYVNANGIVVNSGSHSKTGYYFGLGADYTFWQSLAINGQWQRAKGSNQTGNFDLYSLGVSYLFG